MPVHDPSSRVTIPETYGSGSNNFRTYKNIKSDSQHPFLAGAGIFLGVDHLFLLQFQSTVLPGVGRLLVSLGACSGRKFLGLAKAQPTSAHMGLLLSVSLLAVEGAECAYQQSPKILPFRKHFPSCLSSVHHSGICAVIRDQ